MLPAKIEEPRRWVAGPDGAVERYNPPPAVAPRLGKHQKHRAMRVALVHIETLLKGAKMEVLSLDSTTLAFRYQRFNFTIKIRRPANIAYVTSSHDYKYDPKAKPIGRDIQGNPIYAPQATVKLASDEMKSAYVVEIIGSGVASINPVYIDLPDGVLEPEKYIIKNVIGVIGAILKDNGLISQMEKDTSGELKQVAVDENYLLED